MAMTVLIQIRPSPQGSQDWILDLKIFGVVLHGTIDNMEQLPYLNVQDLHYDFNKIFTHGPGEQTQNKAYYWSWCNKW